MNDETPMQKVSIDAINGPGKYQIRGTRLGVYIDTHHSSYKLRYGDAGKPLFLWRWARSSVFAKSPRAWRKLESLKRFIARHLTTLCEEIDEAALNEYGL